MKKSNRKFIPIIIIFILLISVYYYKNFLVEDSIHELQIISHDKVSTLNSKSDINEIIKSLKTSNTITNIQTDGFVQFYLRLINNKDESLIKNLFIDYKNANIYYQDQDSSRIYKIEEDFEVFYFTHKAFDIIYEDIYPPSLNIIANGKLMKHTSNTKWSYRKLDGVYYSSNSIIEDDTIYDFNKQEVIDLDYSKNPIRLEYVLYKDTTIIESGILKKSLFETPNINGNYRLEIKAIFKNTSEGFNGEIETKINFIIDLPLSFSINKESIFQGDTFRIDVKNLDEHEIPFIKQDIFKSSSFNEIIDGKTSVYIPVSYKTKPGKYKVSYGINNEKSGEMILNVKARDFSIQYLDVDNSVEENTRTDEAYQEFNKYYVPRRLDSNHKAYFDEEFIIPVIGRITTEYGQTRYVNNSPTSYNHSGLDIAAPLGTKVYATNSGKVKLSMFLTLTGNTILIDHGNGFFSTYYHLNERFVNEGDIVNTGDEIGAVGTTGFSTGPHLHFTMSYYNQNIEPGYLIYDEPITYDNYKELFDLK